MKKLYICCLLVLGCLMMFDGIAFAQKNSMPKKNSKEYLRLQLAWAEQKYELMKECYLRESYRADSLEAELQRAATQAAVEEASSAASEPAATSDAETTTPVRDAEQEKRLEGTEKFLPTTEIQDCCAHYIGGKTSGGYKCLNWAKEQYKQQANFQVTNCQYTDEIVGHLKGRQTVSVSYVADGKTQNKTFSEIYFFKE